MFSQDKENTFSWLGHQEPEELYILSLKTILIKVLNKLLYSDLSSVGSQEKKRVNRKEMLHQWYHWVASLIQQN